MSTRNQPKRWPHANQTHVQSQNLQPIKSPPPAAAAVPEKKPDEKTAAPSRVFDTVKTAPESLTARATPPAASAVNNGVIQESRHNGGIAPAPRGQAREIKGLLGTVVWDGTLIVWAMPRLNTRLVIAYKRGTEPENPLNLFNVLVKSNENFLKGMELPGPHGKLDEVNNNTYTLQGTCPRWRGRW
jgi:hypothetical protein